MAYSLDKKDLQEEATALMPPLWREAAVASGLIKSISGASQDIEDTLHQLLNSRDLTTAKGSQLDSIGLILGESRNGRLDSEYRTVLLSLSSSQGSSGTTRDIKNISKLVTGATKCKVFNHFPTATYTWVNKPVNYEESLAIQNAHMAGCRTKVLWTDEVNYVRTAAYPVIKNLYDGFGIGNYIPPVLPQEEDLRDIAFISSGVDVSDGNTNPLPWDSTFLTDIGGTFDLLGSNSYLYTIAEAGSYKAVIHLRFDISSLVTSGTNQFTVQLHSNNTVEELYFFTKNYNYTIPAGAATQQFMTYEYITYFKNASIGDDIGFSLAFVHDVGSGTPVVYLDNGSSIEIAKIGD